MSKAKQFGVNYLLVFVTTIGPSLSVASIIRGAMEAKVVISVDHSNGARLLVTQQFGQISEPFVPEVFLDGGDGKWRWYCKDHQDSFWGRANFEISGSSIHISTAGIRGTLMDTLTGKYNMGNSEGVAGRFPTSPIVPTCGRPPTR